MNSIKSNKKVFGTICGILAAVFYGTNPLGALKLYEQGMTTSSVLFCRFGMAWIIVSIILLFKKESLNVNKREFITLTALGLLFIASSMTLYSSFKYIAAGVASTLLFTYPIMTAVIMALLFKERIELQCKGFCGLVVYTDDFVACFQGTKVHAPYQTWCLRRFRSGRIGSLTTPFHRI